MISSKPSFVLIAKNHISIVLSSKEYGIVIEKERGKQPALFGENPEMRDDNEKFFPLTALITFLTE